MPQGDPNVPSPLRWAAANDEDLRLARQQAAAQAVQAGGVTDYVTTPNYQTFSPEWWNSLSPEEQAEVLRYGWPLKRPEAQPDPMATAIANMKAYQDMQRATAEAKAAKLTTDQQELVLTDPVRGRDERLGWPHNGADAHTADWTNLLLMQRGLSPSEYYFDPTWAKTQADQNYQANMAQIADSLAQGQPGSADGRLEIPDRVGPAQRGRSVRAAETRRLAGAGVRAVRDQLSTRRQRSYASARVLRATGPQAKGLTGFTGGQ